MALLSRPGGGVVLCAQSLAVGWEASLDWIAATLHPLPHRELVGRSHNWLCFARLLVGDSSGPAVFASRSRWWA